MKIAATLLLLALSTLPAAAGNWFGSGPWANATYYPGNLDGKYQAAVFGANISGVLGFALRDGAPPTTVTSQVVNTNSTQSSLRLDPFLNYFAIFVEGRTYTGLTTAGVNYNNNTVTGALIGTQPDFTLTTNSNTTFSTNPLIAPISFTNSTPQTNVSTQIVSSSIPVTNVTPQVIFLGQSNIITTNNVAITNITVTTTNGTSTTNEVVTGPPVYTTNTVAINETNFITNVTFQTVVSNILITNVTFVSTLSNTLVTNDVVSTITNPYTWFNPAPLLNRGLNGGFRASIKSKQSVFTFSGNGQLSTPAQTQTINFTTNDRGDVVTAQVATGTVPFKLDGIRVSFSAVSSTASQPAQ
jgi:hypothetical protein